MLNALEPKLATPDGAPKPGTALRRFAKPRPVVERCDLCRVELPPDHRHLVEPQSRRILCACQACALLFFAEDQKYKPIPRDAIALPNFNLSDAQWNSLAIPIGLAFFFRSTPAGRIVVIYPSPAGPAEAFVDAADWDDIVQQNHSLAAMAADTQALLVNRVGGKRQHLIAPIDQCYTLTGLIRLHWQGFSGGTELWEKIDLFFARLSAGAVAAEGARA